MSPHSFVIIQTQGYQWFPLQSQFLNSYEIDVPLLKVALDLYNTLEHFNMLSPLVPVIMMALHWSHYLGSISNGICHSAAVLQPDDLQYICSEHTTLYFLPECPSKNYV